MSDTATETSPLITPKRFTYIVVALLAISAAALWKMFAYPDIELAIEVRRGARQTTGNYGMIFITNLSPKPIELREVIINRRQDAACSQKTKETLATGEQTVVASVAGMMGLCGGTMSIIGVVTDRGEAEYAVNW